MNQTRRPARTIIVLGMHRSGTSCLTGSLQAAGLDLGEHSTWNPYNRKGNRENSDIMALNDAILAANGGNWHAPPPQVRWNDEHRERAREIIARNADKPVWGFKDPRTLFTLDGWRELLPGARFIGIFRHPTAVAASLRRRGELIRDQQHAYDLWLAYNRRLLPVMRREQAPLLNFDWDEETFHRCLARALQMLHLGGLDPAQRFYDRELINYETAAEPLPWRVRWLYRRLARSADRLRKSADAR